MYASWGVNAKMARKMVKASAPELTAQGLISELVAHRHLQLEIIA